MCWTVSISLEKHGLGSGQGKLWVCFGAGEERTIKNPGAGISSEGSGVNEEGFGNECHHAADTVLGCKS